MTDHRCLAGRACRRPEVIDGLRHGALIEAQSGVCADCRTHMTSAIQHLAGDWSSLQDALGDRSSGARVRIRSTPAPALPISIRKESLAAAIVETAEVAADMISSMLNIDPPNPRKAPPREAAQGSLAWRASSDVKPGGRQSLASALRLIETSVDVLVSVPEQPVLMWRTPERCPLHRDMITKAEALSHGRIEAYKSAGSCDDCNAWGKFGQEREIVDRSGIQIALQLVDLHRQTRVELGQTRLRQRYRMPCPHCGGRLGRDDGTVVITCDDCKTAWTEGERRLFERMITQERLDNVILKYLLDEAYWRLDEIRSIMSKLDPETLKLAGAGEVVAEAVERVLDQGQGHLSQRERAISTSRQDAEERQSIEDTRAWVNEATYRPPVRQKRKPRPVVSSPIPMSSLTMVVDTEDVELEQRPDDLCSCNLIHSGECP